MAGVQVNPTRMEMKRYQTRLQTARRGHKLLKDKRDELMRRFMDVVREDKSLREKVERSLESVYGGFTVAGAVLPPQMLEEALICPKKEGALDVTFHNVMSVEVPVFRLQVYAEGNTDSYNYGMAFTSGELGASVQALNGILEDLLRMAELEKTAQLLAEEIERTRRRVNALEYILMPLLMNGNNVAQDLSVAALTKGIGLPGTHTCMVELKLTVWDFVYPALCTLPLLWKGGILF